MTMVDQPLISVITVSYNAEETIGRTLRSVADQENVRDVVEHLVVDGASTDGTLVIVKRFPHVRWVSQPDDGVADAFNKGLHLTKGKYLLYLNADDYLYDRKALSDVIRFIRSKREPDWVVGQIAAESEVGDERIVTLAPRRFPMTCWSLMFCNRIPHPAVFLKRRILSRVGGFDERFKVAMDYDLWQRLCAEGYSPTHFRRTISVFSTTGISSQESTERTAETKDVLMRFRNTPIKSFIGATYDRFLGKGTASRGTLQQ